MTNYAKKRTSPLTRKRERAENRPEYRATIYLVLSLLLFLLTAAMPSEQPPQGPADLVLRHGRVYTMDASRSWVESIAIKDAKIVYAGPDNGIQQLIGNTTKTVELSGRFVLPGFIDAHVHPLEAGISLSHCDLTEYSTKDEILKAVERYVKSNPKKEWILGSGWQLPAFPEANPKKEWLDAIEPNRPVFLSAADGHSAWVNSKALSMAGITAATADPENGRIERNESGQPSGTLRETAAQLVYRLAPKPSLEESLEGLTNALKVMNGFGITGFLDASVSVLGDSPEARGSANVYKHAEQRNLLTAHVTGALYADPKGTVQEVLKQIDELKKRRDEHKGNLFRPTAVKIFADGVIEANTAALLQPYLDQKDAGKLNWEPEKLNPFVELLDKENFQIHIHAIGDRAIRVSLNALEQLHKKYGYKDRRPVLAHIELIQPEDIPRFARFHAIPCFQPLWAFADPYIKDLTIPKLGDERSRWIYPIRSVSQTAATLALGSDWNVSSVNPLDGIEVAVTRLDPDGKENNGQPFYPEERLDLRTALTAYTIGSAYATFREKETGSIETGKLANLIVLSQNLFEIPPAEINNTKFC